MSTRATYNFKYKNRKGSNCIYIRDDGYPEGAAAYFYETLIKPNLRGNFATQFFLTNEKAELTLGHDFPLNTQFRYDITGSGPEAKIVCKKFVKLYNWKVIFKGPLYKFIDQNSKGIENYNPFKMVKFCFSEHFLNSDTALHVLNQKLNLIRFSDAYESYLNEIQAIVNVFPEHENVLSLALRPGGLNATLRAETEEYF